MPFLKSHSTKQSVKNRAQSIGLHPPTHLKASREGAPLGEPGARIGESRGARRPGGSKQSIPRSQGPELRREPMACEYEGMPLFQGAEMPGPVTTRVLRPWAVGHAQLCSPRPHDKMP